MRAVVEVFEIRYLFGHSRLDLCAFVPFVEACNADNGRPDGNSGGEFTVIVSPVLAVSRIDIVPRPDAKIYISRADRGNEQFVVLLCPFCELGPVIDGGAVREAIGCEIGIVAIEVTFGHKGLFVLFDPQADNNRIVFGVSDGL